ncbi:MAG: hypothetical protein COB41_01535 [Proteobacteria bacterium]|nr:MAG: hypothetical protein COB41_01535 [Pseudomonadota bacterium]
MLLFLFPAQALAIVNAEDTTLLMDEEGLAGKIALSANGDRGNVTTNGVEGSALLRWNHGKDTEILALNYKYGQSRAVRNANKSYIHLRHRHALDEAWALEAFGQAQQDEFANLQLRTLLGGGVRWSQKRDGWRFHLGLGTFYEYEELRKSVVHAKSYLWRASTYMTADYLFNEHTKLHETIYVQPAWRSLADLRILNDTSLKVSLTDHLALSLTLEVSYDSRPPVGTVKTNVSYQTGIEYHF